MKSWIFSDNDQITQPLSGNEALKYVGAHPNAYAWRPTFTHWMPVTYITDFSDIVKAPKAPSIVPKELIESFIVKEKALVDKLGNLDTKIVNAINSLTEFDAEINYYKELTKDCNLEVQETLNNIEQQYARLKVNLKNFTQTASSDKKSFSNTVSDFKSTAVSAPRNVSSSLPTTSSNETVTDPVKSEPDPVAIQVNAVMVKELVIEEPTVETFEVDELVINEPIDEELAEVVMTKSDSFLIDDDSDSVLIKEVRKSVITPSKSPEPGPIINVVAERVVKKSDRVASPIANKAASSLSELVSDASPESVSQPMGVKKLAHVEFSENITVEDLAIAAKIQSMTVDSDMTASYDKHNMVNNAEGDFDYILKGKYVDDGSIGARIEEEDVTNHDSDFEEELVTDLDDKPKKRRRRRR
jgi:hypothetical protein